MSNPWRDVERRLDDLQEEAAAEEEWSDVEAWRAFITGENPRTGGPLSDERREELRQAWGPLPSTEDSP